MTAPNFKPKGTALAVWSVYGFHRHRIATAGIHFPRRFDVFVPRHPYYTVRGPI